MRPTIIVTLGILGGLTFSLLGRQEVREFRAQQAQVQSSSAVPLPPAPPVLNQAPLEQPKVKVTSPDNKHPAWQVTGRWESTRDDAIQSALLAAQTEVINYLRSQTPPVEWTPSTEYVRNFVRNEREEKHSFPGLGEMRRVSVDVQVTRDTRVEMLRADRDFRAQQRMLLLAKLLAGLVVLLGVVAGYLYLDDWTKGYYSGWRLAVVVVAVPVALVLWLLFA